MKNIIIFMLLCFISVSCVDNDDSDIKLDVPSQPELTDKTPVDSKIKKMYENYGCFVHYEFTEEEFTYDWSTHFSTPSYSPAKADKVVDVLDFIEEKVLSIFPTEFCQKYVPLNIYLTDTLMGLYSDWNGHAVNSKLIIGRVGEQFDELDKDELRDAWISIFVERMLAVWPYPTDFAIISDAGYNPSSILSNGTVITYQYVAATTDMVATYAILKFGRRGKYNANGRNMYTTSYAQDFGDYVAFIAFKKPSEKEIYYAKNADVKRKVELVKEYFLENFGITLPEATE